MQYESTLNLCLYIHGILWIYKIFTSKISSDVFEMKQIIIETRLEPKSGILYMGNGEMVDVARNMVPTNEYPSEEKPTKPVVDKSHFQMVDNCKLLAYNILSTSSLYYYVPCTYLIFGFRQGIFIFLFSKLWSNTRAYHDRFSYCNY